MLQQCNTYVICPVDDAVGDETCQPKTSINIWQWCEWSNKKNKNTMSSDSVRTVPKSKKKTKIPCPLSEQFQNLIKKL